MLKIGLFIIVILISFRGIASHSLAYNKKTYASSSFIGATPAQAVDGVAIADFSEANSCWASNTGDMKPYWMVDLESQYKIDHINVTNRVDCCADRLHSIQVLLYPGNPLYCPGLPSTLCAFFPGPVGAGVTQTIQCQDGNATGRFLKINALNRKSPNEIIQICEVTVAGIKVPDSPSNSIAYTKRTYSSSNGFDHSPHKTVDGDYNTNFLPGRNCWEASLGDMNPYWMVDLESTYNIDYVNITNRGDCCGYRLHSIQIMVYEENPLQNQKAPSTLCAFFPGPVGDGATQNIPCENGNATGRFLKINGLNRTSSIDQFTMCEVYVSGFELPVVSNSLAHNKVSYSSSNAFANSAGQAIDGNFNTNTLPGHTCWESRQGDLKPYWMVDLADNYYINYVNITNRGDCCGFRLHSMQILLYAENPLLNPNASFNLCTFYPGPVGDGVTQNIPCDNENPIGRFLKVNGLNKTSINDRLHICEITVSGYKVADPTRKINYVRQGKLLNAKYTLTLSSPSRIHCGTRCLDGEDCRYFRHRSTKEECDLYSLSYGNTIDCLQEKFCYAAL